MPENLCGSKFVNCGSGDFLTMPFLFQFWNQYWTGRLYRIKESCFCMASRLRRVHQKNSHPCCTMSNMDGQGEEATNGGPAPPTGMMCRLLVLTTVSRSCIAEEDRSKEE